MAGFGASGPAPAVYEHFGLTAAAIADLARQIRRHQASEREDIASS